MIAMQTFQVTFNAERYVQDFMAVVHRLVEKESSDLLKTLQNKVKGDTFPSEWADAAKQHMEYKIIRDAYSVLAEIGYVDEPPVDVIWKAVLTNYGVGDKSIDSDIWLPGYSWNLAREGRAIYPRRDSYYDPDKGAKVDSTNQNVPTKTGKIYLYSVNHPPNNWWEDFEDMYATEPRLQELMARIAEQAITSVDPSGYIEAK